MSTLAGERERETRSAWLPAAERIHPHWPRASIEHISYATLTPAPDSLAAPALTMTLALSTHTYRVQSAF